MIREGATTLWERWEKLEGGGMNSHNHIMLGSVDSWFYRTLAGIKAVEPGWKKIVIKPYIPPDMDYATATINSIHGLISSSWEKIKEMLKYRVIIPIGVTGEIWIPKLSENFEIKEKSNTVWINGKFKSESSEIQYKETTENYVIVTLGSGNFEFLIQNLPILPN
jgi:alpha-L-rhamnosidase